jgi:D-alanyl-D-alanine dipeptidase
MALLRKAMSASALMAFATACRTTPVVSTTPATVPPGTSAQLGALARSAQLVVVTTGNWTTTKGTLRRFARTNARAAWTPIGESVPIVVGRTGLAWGVGFDALSANEPIKREGDGKSPAGMFPLDTAFGFAPSMPSLKLPYFPLRQPSDCVDDTASVHYNTVIDRDRAPAVDWNSAEHMRDVGQYRIGVIVGYNAGPPVKPRGSCIFLHIWNGLESSTAGCTAMDAAVLGDVMAWLDSRRSPTLVQLTADAYERLRSRWALP